MNKILRLINKVENLLIAIEDNGANLWHPDLQDTSNCIILDKDIITDHEGENPVKYHGIYTSMEELEKIYKDVQGLRVQQVKNILYLNKKRDQQITLYAVLSEDRGGDTDVTLHSNYKDAKKTFDSIVNDIKDCFDDFNDLDDNDNCFNLHGDHLSYDIDSSSWGNIKIYKKSFKIDDFLIKLNKGVK